MSVETKHMRRVILGAALLFNFSLAITTYTNSSFIENSVSEAMVGILYAISAVMSIYVLSNAARSIARCGNRTFFLQYGVLHALSLTLLVLPTTSTIHILAFVGYLFSGNVLLFSLDVFFDRIAQSHDKGKARGLFLLLANSGWVFAPLITAFIVSLFSYSGTYAFSLFIFAILVMIMHIGLSKYKEPLYTPHRARTVLRRVFKNKIVRTAIITNFILQFFSVWMIVYTPIFLHAHLGLSWETIGTLFAIMLTSFVILDYPLGKLADYLGSEKELTAIGFLIMAASVFGISIMTSANIFDIGVLLFFTRVGAAIVEAMTEIHFFKLTKDSSPELLSIFRDLRPVSYLVAPLVATLIITFFPFRTLFVLLACLLIFASFLALRMEKKSGWWQRAHTE